MDTNSLIKFYQASVKNEKIQHDESQLRALNILQNTFNQLQEKPAKKFFIFKKLRDIKGVYLYGPVGVGKTFLSAFVGYL